MENRCCNCKYAEYNEKCNPVCTCGNNIKELPSNYFGCLHAPKDSKK